jgi:hypothetical protein
MRVLLLLNELNWTGAPKVALDTFAALRDVAKVSTIACTGGPFKRLYRRTIQVGLCSPRSPERPRPMPAGPDLAQGI